MKGEVGEGELRVVDADHSELHGVVLPLKGGGQEGELRKYRSVSSCASVQASKTLNTRYLTSINIVIVLVPQLQTFSA
jgi:hypothetical protein